MIHDDSNCPWGSGNTDLSTVKLTVENRIWIGNYIIHNKGSGGKLAKRFNLKPDRVREMARNLKKVLKLFSQIGRPRLLDAISIGLVDDFYIDNPEKSHHKVAIFQ